MIQGRNQRRASLGVLAGVPLLATALLTGCQSPPKQALWQPTDTPKAPTAEAVSYAAVLPDPGRPPFTPAQRQGLHRFLQGLPDPFRVQVTIQGLPAGRAGTAAATEATRMLVSRGVMPENIRFDFDPIGSGAGGPITVQARYFVARAPGCPDHSHQHLQDGTYRTSSNLGCANAEALARMVADPRDLVESHRTDPSNGAVQADAVRRYEEGRLLPLPTEAIKAGAATQNTTGGAPAAKADK